MKKWQHNLVRNSMDKYRQALENYYIKDKQLVEVGGGYKAFSLLSPPIGSPAAKRRIRFIIKNISDKNTVVEGEGIVSPGKRTPHFITIAVTYDCQCDCSHCSAHSYKEKVGQDNDQLTIPELKGVVNQAIDIGSTCVIFTGGEPLLVDGIFDLIRSVDKRKAVCTIFTNGEFLDKKTVAKLKKAKLFGIFVSLDFADADKHDANRQRDGLFKKAVAGINLCRENGILTGISTFATKEKIVSGQLDDIMELGKKLNVLEVFIFDVIATGKLNSEQACMLDEEDVGAIKKFRQKYNSRPDYPRIIHQTMFTSIAYPCVSEGCPAGVAQMHVRGNGNVCPCDFTPLSFGNVRQKKLSDIWKAITEDELYSKASKVCRLSDKDFLRRISPQV
ncbi:MAG: radical SAM protein [Candidatus Ratteibacteria bacterium]